MREKGRRGVLGGGRGGEGGEPRGGKERGTEKKISRKIYVTSTPSSVQEEKDEIYIIRRSTVPLGTMRYVCTLLPHRETLVAPKTQKKDRIPSALRAHVDATTGTAAANLLRQQHARAKRKEAEQSSERSINQPVGRLAGDSGSRHPSLPVFLSAFLVVFAVSLRSVHIGPAPLPRIVGRPAGRSRETPQH